MENVANSLLLREIVDLDAAGINSTRYDLAIFASGYEKRASHLVSTLEVGRIGQVLILGFTEGADTLSRRANDAVFRSCVNGSPVAASGDDDTPVYDWLRTYSTKLTRPFRLLVDYSSMTRMWYNAILNWVRYSPNLPPVEIDFVYSRGRYIGEYQPLVIKEVFALPGCEGGSVSLDRAVAVFGLGFDPGVALAVCELIEPDVVRSFYASPGSSGADDQRALKANRTFFDNYPSDPIRLPIGSVSACVQALHDLVLPEIDRAHVSLVPLGPKPHVLAAILVSRIFERDISCLRVSGRRDPNVDVEATGELVGTRVSFDTPRPR